MSTTAEVDDHPASGDVAAMAKATMAKGSQSFAAAARLFRPEIRRSATMLYAWCRHCDDVVDEQHLGFRRQAESTSSPEQRIAELEAETRAAFTGESMADPNFRALQAVARAHRLPLRLALDHLDGFRMDVDERRYATVEETLDYCHHVAGVVGVMMSMVMGVHDERTLVRAADLGLAFQLTNIARDLVPDAAAGRVYVPADWLTDVGLDRDAIARRENRGKAAVLARRLVDLAEPYYDSARVGLDALPRRSAWAVATAHGVYREIGLRVAALGERAWDDRVSTTTLDKLRHVAIAGAVAYAPRRGAEVPRAPTLWRHP